MARRSLMLYTIQTISKEKLAEIISKAEAVFKRSDITEQVLFYLEASTHFAESEYTQSFTMSWIIIEKYLSGQWENFLRGKSIGGKRKDKLTNSTLWSIDYVIQTLAINGVIEDNEYRLLMDLKTKRNNFIHNGQKITKDDAENCLRIAESVVRQSVNSLE